MTEIVIVGAGIIGLYTALVLARSQLAEKVIVVAKFLPGDQSVEYTSPYAGGNFSCVSGDDPAALEYDRLSYRHLEDIDREYGWRAGISRLPATEMWNTPPSPQKLASLQSYLADFEIIDDKDFLKGKEAGFGIRYSTFNLNAPFFLKFLYQLLQDLGVRFVRGDLKHVTDAAGPDTKVVFNCSGNGAATLGGVEDSKCYPTRGQIVVVRAYEVHENMKLFVRDREPIYIIPRPFSGGRVVLGGTYEHGNGDANIYGSTTTSIIEKATRLMPKLLDHGDLEIIEERAGLRPSRKGGARIERETINGITVIHNYGAGGTGYQSGIGMALSAVALWKPSARL